MYEEADAGNWDNANKTLKECDKIIEQCMKSIDKDISTQYEAVFLPYNGAMWDSLESVWRAADADADCTAFVIPIPYYDKNADGSLGQCHWEWDLYPSDVPITDYRKYDFANRHPDMIYIHNPYNDANLVTSVDPAFYSDKLKQYTDELIYIPYFVVGDIDPKNKNATEKAKHLMTVPVMRDVDRVYVESENVRTVYINELSKFYGKATRNDWEKKIFALGSPKFDKVRFTKKEDLIIPESWQRLIAKSDGSKKKIIFYNVSIAALLENNEKHIRKIMDVFKFFKEHRNEVTLLWRPHPLLKNTIQSMRPRLMDAYSMLVDMYLSEGWGIYDDSADLDRAIILSDAYYGDWSSVVRLYEATGKPIMIQNMEKRTVKAE